jgi:(1->4)-alpha-D-glucan 1-alpha-D-glucosylmutase
LLAELQGGMDVDEIMRRMEIGMPKLYVVHKALRLRREHPQWFGAESAYTPIAVDGSKIDHLIAYLRGDFVAVIGPRLPLRLGGNWAATSLDLPPGKWRNIFTGDAISGGRQRVGSLLRRFPVALLTREAE